MRYPASLRVGPFLCLALLASSLDAGTPPGPVDPAALVQKLGDPRFAEREKAASELLAVGEDALPALRRASQNDAVELEVRRRAVLVSSSILESLARGREAGIPLRVIPSGSFLMGRRARKSADRGTNCSTASRSPAPSSWARSRSRRASMPGS